MDDEFVSLFQARGWGGQTRGEREGCLARLGKLLLCVLFVIISQQRMPGLFSLKAAHAGDGASHSPFSRQASVTNIRRSVSPVTCCLYEVSKYLLQTLVGQDRKEEDEWRPTSKYFYSRTTNMQIASSWEF